MASETMNLPALCGSLLISSEEEEVMLTEEDLTGQGLLVCRPIQKAFGMQIKHSSLSS